MTSQHVYDFPYGDEFGFPRVMPQWLIDASVSGIGYDLRGWLTECGVPRSMIEIAIEHGNQWLERAPDAEPFVLGRAGRAPQRPGTARLHRALTMAEDVLRSTPRRRWENDPVAIALMVLNSLPEDDGTRVLDFDVGEPVPYIDSVLNMIGWAPKDRDDASLSMLMGNVLRTMNPNIRGPRPMVKLETLRIEPLSSRPPSPLNNPAFAEPYGYFDHVWKNNPMPLDWTCACGLYVHPLNRHRKSDAIHMSDCPYAPYGTEALETSEADARAPQHDEPEVQNLYISTEPVVDAARVINPAWFESMAFSTIVCGDCAYEAVLLHKNGEKPIYCPKCGSGNEHEG